MSEDNQQEGGVIDRVLDAVETAVTGVPAPIKRSAMKAFGRLFSAMVEIPVAKVEGIVEEIRAVTAARVEAIKAVGHDIAEGITTDPKFAVAAGRKFAEKIVGKQANVDAVVEVAALEIASQAKPEDPEETQEAGDEREEISDDWLNQFEREAECASSDEMRARLGKILAGEIQQPSSFSVRALQVIAQLDKRTAKKFQKLCSLSVSISIPAQSSLLDARAISLEGNAATNSLQPFGLSFSDLNELNEAGLIISDYNSYRDFQLVVVIGGNRVAAPFKYCGKPWALLPKEKSNELKPFRINGVMLTRVGMELLPIVDVVEDANYTAELKKFFESKGFTMVGVGA